MKRNLKIAIASISLFSCMLPLSLSLTSCSARDVVFANFESYLSDEIINKYQKNVQFLYYSSSEEIEQKFAHNYDAAVPSTSETLCLMKLDQLSLVDWKFFNLNNYMNMSYTDEDARYTTWGQQITTGIQAEGLLSNGDDEGTVASGADAYSALDAWAWDNGYFPQWYVDEAYKPQFDNGIRVMHDLSTDKKFEASMLDFCIPYFLQNMLFSYKGSYLGSESFNDGWSDITDWTSENSPKHDPRFYGGGDKKGKIYMVDDLRTNYDVCKLYYDQKNNISNYNINPGGAPNYNPATQSIQAYKDIYGSWANNYGEGSHQFILNSDSGELCSSYGKGSGANGFLSYNVDVMASTTGNGEEQDERFMANGWVDDYENWENGNYGHKQGTGQFDFLYPDFGNFVNVLNPAKNLMCYDTIVFNKKLEDNGAKKAKIYDLVNDFAVKGIGWFDPEDTHGNNMPIYQYSDPKTYQYYYDIMDNFDWVMGVSPWNSINSYVKGENLKNQIPATGDENAEHYTNCDGIVDKAKPELDTDKYSYFESTVYDLIARYRPDFFVKYGADAMCSNWVAFLQYCYNVNPVEGITYDQLSELPLTDLSKSNMHWGYESIKGRM